MLDLIFKTRKYYYGMDDMEFLQLIPEEKYGSIGPTKHQQMKKYLNHRLPAQHV